ncbi:hypothetical protein H7I53_25440 [Mycolicibacterium pulveris]|uniref:Uncharacterized protein n=1 Tax=Mycolicibacterium pulveris TaxID=36813 RepID=A0A7I7UPZ9_MYCPV|nr:hypothetical protein [Mycolicibacterium pulveris]MCV6983548.1 hypothetical protein [Mycolicibacterium pulveris]BBY83427.1 hypothetical protein MPUL_45850 [Mycolicibacterium pulveris]
MRLAGLLTTIGLMTAGGIGLPAAAGADATDDLITAVTSARAGYCEPLRFDPLAQRAAEIALASTGDYMDFNARAVPIENVLPVLQDLGSDATTAKLLQGAGRTEADAIRFILISGFQDIPNCAYSRFGGTTVLNEPSGYYLTAVVLAGA